jgi:hypothetical protein
MFRLRPHALRRAFGMVGLFPRIDVQSFSRNSVNSRKNGSMSVTRPIAWKVPRSLSFVTTEGVDIHADGLNVRGQQQGINEVAAQFDLFGKHNSVWFRFSLDPYSGVTGRGGLQGKSCLVREVFRLTRGNLTLRVLGVGEK